MSPAEQHTLFATWLREHAGLLHRVANVFATGADRDDLMQELLLALWRALPAFAGASKPSTFIHRVAHNAALTWRRGAATYARHVERLAAEPRPTTSEPAAGEDEILAAIYEAIRRLPPLDRSLILLQLDGVTYSEIAEIHGMTENHVGVRLTRIRCKLTELLGQKTHELR
ncbi:MAG: polymerase sigma factor YlaC [Verrucomicrobiota bacterium]|jgi:RNA polymerase sigma factor (sigma-70 family)